MDRARAFAVIAVATAFHLLAASAELALTPPDGHQQPAAPATDDQDAAAMARGWLAFVAAHHLPAASWAHTPQLWVGSGPGAGELGLALGAEAKELIVWETTNSQEQLAMQPSPSLSQLLDDHNEPYCMVDFDLSTGSHGYNHYLYRVNVCLQRYKWRRLSCALLVAEKEGAWGTGKEFEALEKANIAKTQLDVLLRSTAGNSKVAPAPATKRATGVKSADTDNCNIKNWFQPHAMKGGSKILPDSVNRATTQTHLDQPLTRTTMEALKTLAEESSIMKKTPAGKKVKAVAGVRAA